MGFVVPLISWVMGSLSFVSFSILINGSASEFFWPSRGIRQRCLLDPILFLIVVEGLGIAILVAHIRGELTWLSFGEQIRCTHVLFVDDIILITYESRKGLETLHEI